MKADRKLEELGAEFKRIEQDKPTVKCSNAAEERGMETSQIVKSLIVRKDGEMFHLCLPGDREVSEGKFGDYRMVEKEKSKRITGQKSGTVHPFASELEHVVDERVFENGEVSFTAGTEKEAVEIKPDELLEAFECADFKFDVRDIVVTSKDDLDELKKLGADPEQASFLAENGHRSVFRRLTDGFEPEAVVDAIREFERNELDTDEELLAKILENSEGQTHMQKIVKNYAETGEIEAGGEVDLEETVEEVIDENPEAVEDYRNGKDSALNFLLGKVMQETGGKADGGKARKLLTAKL